MISEALVKTISLEIKKGRGDVICLPICFGDFEVFMNMSTHFELNFRLFITCAESGSLSIV